LLELPEMMVTSNSTVLRLMICLACMLAVWQPGVATGAVVYNETFEAKQVMGKLPAGWKFAHFGGTSRVELQGKVAPFEGRNALVITSPATGNTLGTFYVPLKLGEAGRRHVRVTFDYQMQGKMTPMFL